MDVRLSIVATPQTCVFTLPLPDQTLLTAQIAYPHNVVCSYHQWQQDYLRFYRHYRGRREAGGVVVIDPPDLAAALETSRVKLLESFENWLNDGALQKIRNHINEKLDSVKHATKRGGKPVALEVYLSCDSPELARLPWEMWSSWQEPQIQVFRTPKMDARSSTVSLPKKQRATPPRRRKPRMLVIIGQDDDLNFQHDLEPIRKKLAQKVELHCVGWNPQEPTSPHSAHINSKGRVHWIRTLARRIGYLNGRGSHQPLRTQQKTQPIDLKQQIAQAIADPLGWDLLYFAGHSNETGITGGKLAIAPNVVLQISELETELKHAVQHGLQFAFFNSCCGIDIAETLTQMGLHQVAIMREPIANTVAQKILVLFLEKLSAYQDVATAFTQICQDFQRFDKRFSYPSAYLLPSLYCAPNTRLFQLPKANWRSWMRSWLPTRWQAIVLTTVIGLSLSYSVQDQLIAQRQWVQSLYRDVTGQYPGNKPPVLLVEIDQESLDRANQTSTVLKSPINRAYLAQILQKLSETSPQVVGVDFSLSDSTLQDGILREAIKQLVQKQQIAFVFGYRHQVTAQELKNIHYISDPHWSLHGSIAFRDGFVTFPGDFIHPQTYPFSYLLAISQLATQENQLNHLFLSENSTSSSLNAKLLTQNRRNQKLDQKICDRWTNWIVDFSIPADAVYQGVPAWKVLEARSGLDELKNIQSQVVIVAPRFFEAGVTPGGDNIPPPPAMIYWWQRRTGLVYPESQKMTGGEVHAYMVHHFLSQHLIALVPDLWMIGIAAFLGKSILIFLESHPKKCEKVMFLAGVVSAGYGLISLQLYVTCNLMFPCLFPISIFWLYFLPTIRRSFYESV